MSASPALVITVNGDTLELGATASVGGLLQRLEIRPERVVVELNGRIYHRGEGLDAPLGAGDVVEIVHFVGGG